MQSRWLLPLFGIAVFIPAAAPAQEKLSDDLSFDGYVATTVMSVYKAVNPDVFYHAKLEFEYRVNKSTEAELQIKMQSNESQRVRLREANIKLKLSKEDRIKVGHLKKPVGEEERFSEEDLPTIDRTHLYHYLSPMNHVGRDIGVQYGHTPNDHGWSYHLGAYVNSSKTGILTARVATDDLADPVMLAASGVFQNMRLDEGVAIQTILGNISATYEGKGWYGNVEAFAGVDPFASRFRQLELGNTTEKVWLAGAKCMASYRFRFDGEHQGVEPVVVAAYLLPDTRRTQIFTMELLIGLNYYVNKHTRARLNVHPLLSKNGIDNAFSQAGSSVSAEFQLRW